MPTLTAKFDTRREAEMTVERLVQELHIDRTGIFITTEDAENSAGQRLAGSDTEAGAPSPDERNDAALAGQIVVSIDIQDEGVASGVKAAFAEFYGDDVTSR